MHGSSRAVRSKSASRGATSTGDTPGSVAWAYDSATMRLASQSVSGVPVAFGYDDDGLLTSAGTEVLTRDTANGRVVKATTGFVVETWTYDSFGDLASQDVAVSGVPLFRRVLTRDTLGRVTKVDTTQGGSTHSAGYGYDAENRLASETLDGAPTHSWTFDADGHRLTADGVTSTYDATGRHLSAGATNFTWDAFGSLASRTEGGHGVTYQHDGDGHLLKVTDGATVIEYGYDARGRRISRKKNGAATTGWLYDSQWRVIAETDGAGAVQRRYVYTQQSNSPDLMVAGGKTYRLLHDERGSVLAVIDSATGAAAETVTYSAWGEVLADSAPGFQSLKYAGGVFDADTGLVHFGARDCEAKQGRYLFPEPMLEEQGYVAAMASHGMLAPTYAYAANSPLMFADPDGRTEVDPIGRTIFRSPSFGFRDSDSS